MKLALPVMRGIIDRRMLLNFRVRPVVLERVESSFFANENSFPPGSIEFDSAFLMRGLEHEWHARGKMKAGLKGGLPEQIQRAEQNLWSERCQSGAEATALQTLARLPGVVEPREAFGVRCL